MNILYIPNLSICLSIHPSVHPSIHPSIFLRCPSVRVAAVQAQSNAAQDATEGPALEEGAQPTNGSACPCDGRCRLFFNRVD